MVLISKKATGGLQVNHSVAFVFSLFNIHRWRRGKAVRWAYSQRFLPA